MYVWLRALRGRGIVVGLFSLLGMLPPPHRLLLHWRGLFLSLGLWLLPFLDTVDILTRTPNAVLVHCGIVVASMLAYRERPTMGLLRRTAASLNAISS